MADSIRFIGGDDVIEPFLIDGGDGSPMDLAGAEVAATVRWGDEEIVMSDGNGIQVQSATGDGGRHGYVVLSRDETSRLPFGRVATLTVTVLSAAGQQTSTIPRYLERLA